MNQEACPPPDALESLLAATLPTDQETVVTLHIENCPACQSQLETLTSDQTLQSFSNQKAILEQREEAPAWLLAKVNQPDASELEPDDSLPFLKQSQYPDDLGLLGHYRVKRILGRGGMGVVLQAYDPTLKRLAAIKVLWPPPGNATARRRMLREAQAVAQVRNEHVVGLYAIHDDPSEPPYLVMEYVPGTTLREHLKSGDVPLAQIVSWGIDICDGLIAAHAAGLTHRDIKPGNILIDEATQCAKLTDFGLARVATSDSDHTHQAILAGTPAYMSPEQIKHPERVDVRSDIYGLGATLYDGMTGGPPFRGPVEMLIKQVVDIEPLAPRRLNPSVPVDLETICIKCLAKEPAQRYPTADALKQDLQRYLEGKPILARPLGIMGRFTKAVKRRPLIASMATLLVISLFTGTAVSLYQWYRAERNLVLANDKIDAAFRTIDQFCLRVSEDRLLSEAGMQPLRKELLQIAIPELQKLSVDKPDDTRLYDKWIKSTYTLAKLRRDIEGPAAALPSLNSILPTLHERFRQEPANGRLRQQLADVLIYQGICHENLLQFAQANAIWKEVELLLEGKNEPNDRLLHSRLCINMGKTAFDQGDQKQGGEFAQKAREIAQQLTQFHPEILDGPYCLATSTGNYASSLASQRNYADAEKMFREGIKLWQAIADDHPKDLLSQMEELRLQSSLAEMYLLTQRFADAGKELESGLPAIEKLVRRYPQSLELKKFHGQFLIYAGLCSHMTGLTRQAGKHYQRAVETMAIYHEDDPNDVAIYYDLIRARLLQAYLWQDVYQLEDATRSFEQLNKLLQDYAGIVPTAAQEMKGHSHTVRFSRAMVLTEQGKVKEAQAELKQIEQSGPASPAFLQMVQSIVDEKATGKDQTVQLLKHYRPFMRDCLQAEASLPQTAGMYYLAASCAGRCLRLIPLDKSLSTSEQAEQLTLFRSAILRWLAAARRLGYLTHTKRQQALHDNGDWHSLRELKEFNELVK